VCSKRPGSLSDLKEIGYKLFSLLEEDGDFCAEDEFEIEKTCGDHQDGNKS